MNNFADLKAQFSADPTNAEAAQNLAAVICSCVIRKLLEKTAHSRYYSIQRSLYADAAALKSAIYSGSGKIYAVTYNRNGDAVTEVVDKARLDAQNAAAAISLGDGADMMQAALVALYSAVDKWGADLDAPIRAKKNGQCVFINDAALSYSVIEYDSTPIQQVFKAVRRHIQQHSSISALENGYTYIDEQLADADIADFVTGEQAVIYRRLPKYADLGGAVCSRDAADDCIVDALCGMNGVYTADAAAADDMQALLGEVLSLLSKQQQAILRKRLQGNSTRACADALGIDQGNLCRQLRRMQKKLVDAGILAAERMEK